MDKAELHKVFTNKLKTVTEKRGTKEVNYTVKIDGVYMCRVTVPKGRGELPPGTLNSIKNQTLLSRNDFERLVKCPMKLEEYKQTLLGKNEDSD